MITTVLRTRRTRTVFVESGFWPWKRCKTVPVIELFPVKSAVPSTPLLMIENTMELTHLFVSGPSVISTSVQFSHQSVSCSFAAITTLLHQGNDSLGNSWYKGCFCICNRFMARHDDCGGASRRLSICSNQSIDLICVHVFFSHFRATSVSRYFFSTRSLWMFPLSTFEEMALCCVQYLWLMTMLNASAELVVVGSRSCKVIVSWDWLPKTPRVWMLVCLKHEEGPFVAFLLMIGGR